MDVLQTNERSDRLWRPLPRVKSRQGLIAIVLIMIAAGLAFNWSWLLAIGVAPVLIGILPCAVMCALGLCMRGMHGGKCETASPQTATVADERDALAIPDQSKQSQHQRSPTDA